MVSKGHNRFSVSRWVTPSSGANADDTLLTNWDSESYVVVWNVRIRCNGNVSVQVGWDDGFTFTRLDQATSGNTAELTSQGGFRGPKGADLVAKYVGDESSPNEVHVAVEGVVRRRI